MTEKYPSRRDFLIALVGLGGVAVASAEVGSRFLQGKGLLQRISEWFDEKRAEAAAQRHSLYKTGAGDCGKTVYSMLDCLDPILIESHADYENAIAEHEYVFDMCYRENQAARNFAEVLREVAPAFPNVQITLQRNDFQSCLGVKYATYRLGEKIKSGILVVDETNRERAKSCLEEAFKDLTKRESHHQPSERRAPTPRHWYTQGVPV